MDNKAKQLNKSQQSPNLSHAEQASQQRARRYHQFVIAVSANSDEETVHDALRAGADTFMSKPFAYDTFALLMERHNAISLNTTPTPAATIEAAPTSAATVTIVNLVTTYSQDVAAAADASDNVL